MESKSGILLNTKNVSFLESFKKFFLRENNKTLLELGL